MAVRKPFFLKLERLLRSRVVVLKLQLFRSAGNLPILVRETEWEEHKGTRDASV
jgi:hypothetical protein